jgi:hypothetical protein
MLLMWKSVGNLYKVRLEVMPVLRYHVSNKLDGVLMKDVIKERVKDADRPNIRGQKRIHALTKKEEDDV